MTRTARVRRVRAAGNWLEEMLRPNFVNIAKSSRSSIVGLGLFAWLTLDQCRMFQRMLGSLRNMPWLLYSAPRKSAIRWF